MRTNEDKLVGAGWDGPLLRLLNLPVPPVPDMLCIVSNFISLARHVQLINLVQNSLSRRAISIGPMGK